MSISRAYRDIIAERDTPEFAEYIRDLFQYKDEHKRWQWFRKTSFKASENPLERLQYFEAQERFRKACVVYKEAKKKYETFRLKMRLGDLSPKKIAQMMDIKIPKSLDDLIREAKTIAPIVTMTEEQVDIITRAAMENMQRSESTKEQFMRRSEGIRDEDDPTFNDDTPLPDSSVKKDDENS